MAQKQRITEKDRSPLNTRTIYINTEYCATRYTNDNPTPSRHLAIDIVNNTGTPIMASNNGKVVHFS